jgi:hypothetical protein
MPKDKSGPISRLVCHEWSHQKALGSPGDEKMSHRRKMNR